MTRFMDYRQAAAKYDRRYDGISFDGIERELLTFAGDRANRVLEVGCGTGHWLAFLESHGYSVSGMDPSPLMLDQARDRVLNGDLREGNAHKILWGHDSFDRVFCVNAVHHFERKPEFASEAFRVLRSLGCLLIVGLDPHKGVDLWSVYDYFEGVRELDLRRYPATSEVESLMQAAGFSECRTIEAHHMSLRLPARSAIEGGLVEKTMVSQLGLLNDVEYDRGIQRIWEDITNLEAHGEDAVLVVDLRFYATIGWKRS